MSDIIKTTLPIAEDVEFDNSTNGFVADNVQDAIEEAINSSTSASPGFSFGRSGNVSSNTWLKRPGNVSSNRAGVTIPIANPVIKEVSCSNRNIDNYTINIYEHDGNTINLVLLGSVVVTGARGGTFAVNFPSTKGKQIAVRLGSGSGSVRDLGVDIIIEGDLS